MTNNKKSILNDLKFASLLLAYGLEALDGFLFQNFELLTCSCSFYTEFSPREETEHLKQLADVIDSESLKSK